MGEAKIHYAQSDMAACGREVANMRAGQPMIQHTTIPENVTCKQCRRVVENEDKLKDYLAVWCDINVD